jgi:membrane protease YdiL (CAAX protease family)
MVAVLAAFAAPADAAAVSIPDDPWLPPALLARAASPDPAVRSAAAAELAEVRTLRAENLLVVMLQRDYDPGVRAAAARALGTTHNPEHIQPLRWAADSDHGPGVREAATSAADALMPFAFSPKWAAAYSTLCPGCGYFYLHQPGRAAAYLGSGAALVLLGFHMEDDNPTAPNGERLQDHDDPLENSLLTVAQDLWFYGIFAAYRDARVARADLGYHYPVAKEQMTDLLAAPFNPRVLKSPWVWAGVPALLGAGLLITKLVSPTDLGSGTRSLSDGRGVNFLGYHYGTTGGFALGETYNLGQYLPVGVGEEALFRGVILAGLSETSLGLWGGWAASSAIFGGAHVFNYLDGSRDEFKRVAVAVPFLMATGGYLGLVFIKSDFSLLENTAVHFWYDFLLGTISFIADPDHQPWVVQYGRPF